MKSGLTFDYDYVTLRHGTLKMVLPREDFNGLVGYYIGADAIRAALKAKDDEIARLEKCATPVNITNEVYARTFAGPKRPKI